MWYCPDKYKVDLPDANQEILSMEGLLNDRDAKISLAKFLRSNLGFTTELLSGIKLAPYQEITKEEYDLAMTKMPMINFSALSLYERQDRGEGSREL